MSSLLLFFLCKQLGTQTPTFNQQTLHFPSYGNPATLKTSLSTYELSSVYFIVDSALNLPKKNCSLEKFVFIIWLTNWSFFQQKSWISFSSYGHKIQLYPAKQNITRSWFQIWMFIAKKSYMDLWQNTFHETTPFPHVLGINPTTLDLFSTTNPEFYRITIFDRLGPSEVLFIPVLVHMDVNDRNEGYFFSDYSILPFPKLPVICHEITFQKIINLIEILKFYILKKFHLKCHHKLCYHTLSTFPKKNLIKFLRTVGIFVLNFF